MNNDQVKGRIKEMDGTAKEIAGKVVGDKSLEEKGKLKKAVGKVQTAYGDLKNEVKKES